MGEGSTALARTLRERRRALGLTRSRLSERTGIEVVDLTRWERGESLPTARQAVALAEAVGLDEAETRAWLDEVVVVDLTGPEVAVQLVENPDPPADPFLRRSALLRTEPEPGVLGKVASKITSVIGRERSHTPPAAPLRARPASPRPAPTTTTGLVREPRHAVRQLPSVFPEPPVASYDPATHVYSTGPAVFPTPGEEQLYVLRRVRTTGVLLALGLILWWALGALGQGLGDVIDLFRTPIGG